MAERTMTREEMLAYLAEPHVATLVTLNKDESPDVARIWYEYRDDKVYVVAEASSVEVKNTGNDQRVAIYVANDVSPAKYVLVYGYGRVTTDNVETTTYDIYNRYQGKRRGPGNARERLAETSMVAIVVEPTKVVSWISDEDH